MSISREQLEYQARKMEKVQTVSDGDLFLPVEVMKGLLYFKYNVNLVVTTLSGAEGGFVTQTYKGDEFIIFVDKEACLRETIRHELFHVFLAGHPTAIFAYPQSEEQIVTRLTTVDLSLLEKDLCDFTDYLIEKASANRVVKPGDAPCELVLNPPVKERPWLVVSFPSFMRDNPIHSTWPSAYPVLIIKPHSNRSSDTEAEIRAVIEGMKPIRLRTSGRYFAADLEKALDTGYNYRTQCIIIVIVGFSLYAAYRIAEEVGHQVDSDCLIHGFIISQTVLDVQPVDDLDQTLVKDTYGWRKSIK